MVRPRLVQEGTPIYGPGSDGEPIQVVDDEPMATDDRNKGSSPHPTVGVSSLVRAATTIPKKPDRQATITSFEIGGGNLQPSDSKRTNASSLSALKTKSSHRFTIDAPNASSSNGLGVDKDEMEMDEDMTKSRNGYHPSFSFEIKSNDNSTNHDRAALFTKQQHQVSSVERPLTLTTRTSYTVGATSQQNQSTSLLPDKMEGVQDHGVKPALCVLDGANVAHHYAQARVGVNSVTNATQRPEPDVTGILVATEYFQAVGLRVLIVLPQYWFRSKNQRTGSSSGQWSDALVKATQLDILDSLLSKGLIVSSPPADDDDAYALTIARREEGRSLRRQGQGPGFVVSNDFFRDAQARDTTGILMGWLKSGRHESIGPGRISYTFCDMGTMNDHGERILDFVPNPRHPLVIWSEGMLQHGGPL